MSEMRASRKPCSSNTSFAAASSRARVCTPLRERGPLGSTASTGAAFGTPVSLRPPPVTLDRPYRAPPGQPCRTARWRGRARPGIISILTSMSLPDEVAAELAIRRVLAAYCHRCDDGDLDGVVDLFAADGVFASGAAVARG